MFPRARSSSLTHRIVAILMALVVLVAGQGVHVPVVQADADVGAPDAMSGHTSDERAVTIGDVMPPGDGLQSEQACVGTECGSCAATVTSSVPGPPSLYDLLSDHAVINSAVRPPERLFRPPILLP